MYPDVPRRTLEVRGHDSNRELTRVKVAGSMGTGNDLLRCENIRRKTTVHIQSNTPF